MQIVQDPLFPLSDVQTKGYAKPEQADENTVENADDVEAEAA